MWGKTIGKIVELCLIIMEKDIVYREHLLWWIVLQRFRHREDTVEEIRVDVREIDELTLDVEHEPKLRAFGQNLKDLLLVLKAFGLLHKLEKVLDNL